MQLNSKSTQDAKLRIFDKAVSRNVTINNAGFVNFFFLPSTNIECSHNFSAHIINTCLGKIIKNYVCHVSVRPLGVARFFW